MRIPSIDAEAVNALRFVFSLLLFAANGQAAEIELPKEKTGQPGQFVALTALTEGKAVLWVPLDAGLTVFPADLLRDSKTFVAIAPKAGRYRVLAITAIGDTPHVAETTLIIGDAPNPGPGPDPIPPPTPDLAKKFQAAYDAEKSPAKRGQLVNLIGLYSAMIDHAKDRSIDTTAALLGDLKKVAAELIQPNILIDLRKAISAEILLVLGEPGAATALDDATRARAVAVFERITKSLGEVK